MTSLKEFYEYESNGTISKQTPDIPRAKSLKEESLMRYNFLKELNAKIPLSDENANYIIETIYDILIEIIRSKLLSDGYASRGEGAHEAEVSYMKLLGFSESTVRFMDGLRFYRNRIKYYGKKLDKEYANKCLAFLDETYPKLKNMTK